MIFSYSQFIGEKKNPCWKGYKQIGTKKKGSRTVPNCVKIQEQSSPVSNIFRELAVKDKVSSTMPESTDTKGLLRQISLKMKGGDQEPIYVFNNINSKDPFYVAGKLFDNPDSVGFSVDPSDGLLLTNSGKYSFCILNCTMEDPDMEMIQENIRNIAIKNQSSGIKTIVEITNISFLQSNSLEELSNMVTERRIGGLKMIPGDFFILSDNSNSRKGGKDLSKSISKYFPTVKMKIYNNTDY